MNRRDFIKNSFLVCSCSCFLYGGKVLYDSKEGASGYSNIKLEQKHLIEQYKNKNELPKIIGMNACTLCQLNCPICLLRLYPDDFNKGCGIGYLTFNNFKKLVDENDLEEINFINQGEMFLNPELFDIIKYSYCKNIKIYDYSGVNMNYLPDKIAEALVKYEFKALTVSIDAATPETYVIYRRGGDFNTVINNIKKINYYKKKYNSIYPLLTYKFILFGHNEHEIDKARELAKELDMQIFFVQNWNPTYSPVKNVALVKEKTGLNPSEAQDETKAKNYKKNSNEWFYCKQLWKIPLINWDGRVSGCCCCYFSDFGGNAFKDGLLKALNNPKMIYAKNMLTGNAKPIEGIPCYNCGQFHLFRKLNIHIKRDSALLT